MLNNIPTIIENIRAIKLPAILDLIEFFSRSRSPSVVARAKATLGPKRGAITMAPIITATLSFSIPIDATIDETIIRNTKNPDNLEFVEILVYSSCLLIPLPIILSSFLFCSDLFSDSCFFSSILGTVASTGKRIILNPSTFENVFSKRSKMVPEFSDEMRIWIWF